MPVTSFTVDPEYVLDLLKVRPCEFIAVHVDVEGRIMFEVQADDIPEDAPRCVVIHERTVVARKFEPLIEAPDPPQLEV